MQEFNNNENVFNENFTNNTFQEDLNAREFGRDITNGFNRKSLDQSKFLKQSNIGNFDKYENRNTLNNNKDNLIREKRTQTMSFNNFKLAPRQSFQNVQTFGINNIKKQVKKVSCNLPEQNKNNVMNIENDINLCETVSIDLQNGIPLQNMGGDIMMTEPNHTHNSYSLNSTSFINKTQDNPLLINFNKINLNDTSNTYYGNQYNHELEKKKSHEVWEYCDEIFLHLKDVELSHPEYYPFPGYMKNQFDINEKMRAILYDWLVDVHLKFKLLPETLFLAFNLIDRYLNKKSIHRTKLQLLGVTSMLIACKYEEIYAPEVKDFVYITDKAYTADEVKAMESDILITLEFNVTMPSSYRFLEFFNFYIKYDNLVMNFTFFLLELSIVEYKMLKYKASLIAAAVLYVSTKLLHKENIVYNPNIETNLQRLYDLSGFMEEEIKECAKEVCMIYDNSDKSGLAAIKKKFSLPKFEEVSKIKFGK